MSVLSPKARPNIFEVEARGEPILEASKVTGIDEEREMLKFRTADGEPQILPGDRNAIDFELHTRDAAGWITFWNWYNSKNPEPWDFGVHGKDQSKNILYSIEFESVLPRGISLDDHDTENTTAPQNFIYKLTGIIQSIS